MRGRGGAATPMDGEGTRGLAAGGAAAAALGRALAAAAAAHSAMGRDGDRAAAGDGLTWLTIARQGRRVGGGVGGASAAGRSRTAGGERGVALSAVDDGAVVHGVDHGA